MRLRSLLPLLFCTIISSASAQVTSANAASFVTNITSTPVPGVGHDYLHVLNETVNPANGSLSIRIEAPRPVERGLNQIPIYAFMYDSDTEYQVSMLQTDGNCTGSIPDQTRIPTCVNNVGQPAIASPQTWSPSSFVSYNSSLSYSEHSYTYYETNVQIANCRVRSGYMYQDPYGARHPLFITSIETGQSNGMEGTSTGICQEVFSISPYPVGGDAHYKGLAGDVNTNNLSLGTVYVTDANGNSMGPTIQNAGVGVPEDSNGNCLNTTGRSGSYTGFSFSQAATCAKGAGSDLGNAGTSNYSVTYPGTAGAYSYTVAPTTMTYAIGYRDISATSDLLCGGGGTNASNVFLGSTTKQTSTSPYMSKFTSIQLPDGLFYHFTYDPVYGYINKVTYPTGAWVEYTWAVNANAEAITWTQGNARLEPVNITPGYNLNTSCSFRHDFPVIIKRVVSYDGVNPAQEQDFSYTTTWPSTTDPNWTSKQTVVTTKDLIRPGQPSYKTTYNYTSGVIATNSDIGNHIVTSAMPMESTIVVQDTSGNVIRTTGKIWSDATSDAQITGECDILANGNISGKFYQYLTYSTSGLGSIAEPVAQTSQMTDVAEYDYGTVSPGANSAPCVRPNSTPSRETKTTFRSFGATSGWPAFTWSSSGQNYPESLSSMWGKPASTIIYDRGVRLAETDYGYDETALQGVTGSYGHDEVNYGTSATQPRGNLTTITKNCFVAAQTCPNAVTKIGYDTTGQPVSVTDANLNQTLLSYADNYTSDDGSPTGNTNTYVTKITRPTANGVQHISRFQYDFNKGELRAATDENNQTSSYQYSDPWNRLTTATSPDGGQKTVTYSDAGPNPSVQTQTLMNSSSPTIKKTTKMDAAGHVIQTQLTTDPSGTDYVDTVYDGIGEVQSVSNPYRTKTDPTYGLTNYAYDALGRTISLTHSTDNSSQTWLYASNQVTSTDETGRVWERSSDGLGRLTQVLEPDGVGAIGSIPTLETDYQYDALNNLLRVDQWGGPNGTAGERLRLFQYNSLSRLTNACNPEGIPSASTCGSSGPWSGVYAYDAAGNVLTKKDARAITTNYFYDALNRLTSKTYTVPSPAPADYATTPPVTFSYDQTSFNSLTITNGIGRRTGMTDGPGKSAWSYDPLGRVAKIERTTNGLTNTLTDTYDLAGDLTNINYYSGSNVTYTYDGAGRPISAIDTANSFNFVTAVTYAPPGEITGMVNGPAGSYTGLTLGSHYDGRLRLTQTSANTTAATLESLSYTYDTDGNMQQIVNNVTPAHNQTFQYDNLNRLTSGQAGTLWGNTNQIDPFGNLSQFNPIAGVTPGQSMTLTPTPNNQLSGGRIVYDAAGNMSSDMLGTAYFYDAENRIAKIGSTTYAYDGDGNRVIKTGGSANRTYWLGVGGEVLNEFDTSGNNPVRNIYLGGALRARRYGNGNIDYIAGDQIGSARIVVNASGTVEDSSDYLPFGKTASYSTSTSSDIYKFTGKERDAESGLDYFGARYYASNMGRWMSPDPMKPSMKHLTHPQRWNMYSYVQNNPLNAIDPDGWDDFKIFLNFSRDDLGGHDFGAGWMSIAAQARANGHTVEFLSGTASNYRDALQSGSHVIDVGHTQEVEATGQALGVLMINEDGTGNLGNTFVGSGLGELPNGYTMNASSVDIFGCNSIDLASQYSQAGTFVGVNSGADAETNAITLTQAGQAFLQSATSQNASQAVDLTKAAGAAQQVITGSTNTTPVNGVPTNVDKGDKVVVKQN